jgi:serine/threonine protein kinase
MILLSLCQNLCPTQIPVVPGTKLGDGSDGEVFEIEDDPYKVIKFCIFYDNFDCDAAIHYAVHTKPNLNYLIGNPSSIYARVYAHEHMGSFSRDFMSSTSGKQSFVLYYYIMEKLNKISEDEKKVFHSILSHEDRGIDKNFPVEKVTEMLQGLSRGLDFDSKRVIFFYEQLISGPIIHMDLHPRNIMKDAEGNFKLIDFDRIQLKLETNK